VTVEPDFVDKRGSFFGTVTLSNKKDFGLILVEEGLGEVNIVAGKVPMNIDQLEDAQAKAQEEGLGIWGMQSKLAQTQSP
jgi:endonuclease YncB( thermonuclease family)